jgi:WD40 repeat protein
MLPPIPKTFSHSRHRPRLFAKLVIALTACALLAAVQATCLGYAHPRSSFNAPPSPPHTSMDGTVVFSHDGELLAAADVDDQKIRVWDVSSGREKFALDGGPMIAAVAFSPDGHWLLSGGWLKNVTLWDLTSGLQTRTWKVATTVRSLAFDADNRTFAIGMDQEISLWQVDAQHESHSLKAHKDWVTCLAFSPDGRTLASGSKDLSVRLWDLAGGQPVATLDGSSQQLLAVAFNPDGHTLASLDMTGSVRIWDVPAGTLQRTLEGMTLGYVPTALTFSRDGQTLASAGAGAVVVWDAAHSFNHLMLQNRVFSQAVTFNADVTQVFAGGAEGVLAAWNPVTGEELPRRFPQP